MNDQQAQAFVQGLEAWMREQPLRDLAPSEQLKALVEEFRQDDALWTDLRPRFERAWEWVERRLRAEQRPTREVLAPETSARLLDALEQLEPDPETVRAFLRSPAIEEMLGEVLYHGISEFLSKADLVGRIVNRLPVIGPIRKKVMAVFKDEWEVRLEAQLKSFLGQSSGKAVERMIEHVLSEQNRAGFSAARRRVGEHLLARPVSSLIPGAETSARARDQVWESLRQAALREESQLLDQVYQDHGADTWGDWTWRLTPRATEFFARPLARFLASAQGQAWKVAGEGE